MPWYAPQLGEVTMKRVTAPSLLLLVAICSMAQKPRFDGKTWWHHVEVLAADDMEGRGTGSPGLQRAEDLALFLGPRGPFDCVFAPRCRRQSTRRSKRRWMTTRRKSSSSQAPAPEASPLPVRS